MMIFGWSPKDQWDKLNKKGKNIAVVVAVVIIVAVAKGI